MNIKIYGASDDLIEVEGDIREEYDAYGNPRHLTLVGKNGGAVEVVAHYDGDWHFEYSPIWPEGVDWHCKKTFGQDVEYSQTLYIDTLGEKIKIIA